MAQENIEVIVRQFAAVNARDFDTAMDLYAEGVTLVVHGELGEVWGGSVTGKAAVGRRFGDWFRQFEPGYHFEIEEARESGERVLVVAFHRGRGRASGVPVEGRTAYVFTVRAGKVARVEMWSDRQAALEAAGLTE